MMKKTLLLSGLFLQQLIPAFAQKSNEQPNVILILSDDHSYPFLGCAGNPDIKTPNIDRLAKDGIQYHNVYTTAPQSVPSRASLMTGRNVLDVQMSRFSAALGREFTTYPEVLKENGYYTGICGRNFHLDGSSSVAPETAEAFEKYNMLTFKDRVDFLRRGNNDTAVPQFMEFMESTPSDKPFFIQVGFSDPHRVFDAYTYEPDPKSLTIPSGMPDTEELRKDLAGHYGEIMRLDENVGKIMNELEKRKKLKNTLVIFMGDNGSALLRGKGTLNRLGLHVPLVMMWEGKIKKGSNCYSLISGEDLAPTILEATKSIAPEEMTGKSFVKTFTDDRYEIRDVAYAIRVAHGSGLPKSTEDFDLIRSAFNKEYKLVYNVLWQLPYAPVDFQQMPVWTSILKRDKAGKLDPFYSRLFLEKNRSMFEFYDLRNDPNEFNNVSGKAEYKEIEHQFKALMHDWMIRYNDYCPLPIEPGKHQSFLFIGNSFTMRHELPSLFAKLAEEGNPETTIQTEIVGYGGRNLFQHWECLHSYDRLSLNTMTDIDKNKSVQQLDSLFNNVEEPAFYTAFWNELVANTFYKKYNKNNKSDWKTDRQLIKSAISKHNVWIKNASTAPSKFDFVVLQSWLDVTDNSETGYFKYAAKFADVAKSNGIKPVLYLTSPYAHNQTPVTQAVAREQAVGECKVAKAFAKIINAIVVPVPLAITLAQESAEPVARTLTFRYNKDFHPNNTMAYLTACTFYAAVYGKSPEGLQFNKVTENKLQNIHGEAVSTNAKTAISSLVNPDGGPVETVFTDEERIFLQRIAWQAVKAFRNEKY